MNNDTSMAVVNNTTNITINSLSFINRNTFKISYYAFNHKYGTLLSHLTLVLIALSIIYVASYASLSRPKNAPKLHKSHPNYYKLKTSHDSQDLDKLINENFAIFIPVVCTFGLLSIYYSTKYFDSSNISWALNNYTLVFSLFAFAQFFQFLIKISVMKLQKKGLELNEHVPRFRFTLTQDDEILNGSEIVINDLYQDKEGKTPFIDHIEEDFQPPNHIKSKAQILNIYISSIDLISLSIAAVLSYTYYKSQSSPNWIFANFVAWCFAFEGILKFHISSFKVGAIILIGLFFYDIYFVFKSDIMVTVASSIDIPVMMRLPSGQNYQNITINPLEDYLVPKLPFSMLGLGDIVVPGAFIAMCLRYDLYKHHAKNKYIQYDFLNNFKNDYFIVAMSSYIIGLILTFTGLHYSNKPQPALLYLSPCLILGVVIHGLLNGEFKQLFKYSEIDEEEQKRRENFKKKMERKKKRQEKDKELMDKEKIIEAQLEKIESKREKIEAKLQKIERKKSKKLAKKKEIEEFEESNDQNSASFVEMKFNEDTEDESYEYKSDSNEGDERYNDDDVEASWFSGDEAVLKKIEQLDK